MEKKVKGYEKYYTINQNGEVFSIKTKKKLAISKDVKTLPAYRFFDKKRFTVEELLINNGFVSLKDSEFIYYKDDNPFNTNINNIVVLDKNKDREKIIQKHSGKRAKELYKDYFFTDDGEVYSMKNNKIKKLSPFLRHDGYYEVKIQVNREAVHVKIHRAVATLFVENKKDNSVVNHIDGNKLNNHYSNLEWTDSFLNNEHAKLLQLNKTYKLAKRACLVDKNNDILKIYDSIGQLAKDIGKDESSVAKQTRGELNKFSNGLRARLYNEVANDFIPTKYDHN